MAPNIGAILLVILSSCDHVFLLTKDNIHISSMFKDATNNRINKNNNINLTLSRFLTGNDHKKSRKLQQCDCLLYSHGNKDDKNNGDRLLSQHLTPFQSILAHINYVNTVSVKRKQHKTVKQVNDSVKESSDGEYYRPLKRSIRNDTLELILERLSKQLPSHKENHGNQSSMNMSFSKTGSALSWSSNNKLPFFYNGNDVKVRQHVRTSSIASVKNKRNWNRSYSRHNNIFVFGRDDRTKIVPSLLRKFPYSNIVRLSTGCTGTLITPYHVLTAAHCVHNGREFLNKLEMMKVEVPDPIGSRVYYIEKISIPDRWLNPRSRNYKQASFDYAVVRLSYGVHGRYQFLPLSVPTESTLHQNLQFLGFPNYGFGLWQSICPARTTKPIMGGNLILSRCDSAIGNSGAAIFTADFRSEKKVIGVLSSTVSMDGGSNPMYQRYSVITALTETKLMDICTEIGSVGFYYGVCPSPEYIAEIRQGFQRKIKTIPFFG